MSAVTAKLVACDRCGTTSTEPGWTYVEAREKAKRADGFHKSGRDDLCHRCWMRGPATFGEEDR